MQLHLSARCTYKSVSGKGFISSLLSLTNMEMRSQGDKWAELLGAASGWTTTESTKAEDILLLPNKSLQHMLSLRTGIIVLQHSEDEEEEDEERLLSAGELTREGLTLNIPM